MKSAINTVIFIVLFSVNSWSQNLVYSPVQHRVDQIMGENSQDFSIYLTTPTPEAIHYKWELISNSIPSTWSYAMCDYGACYPAIPATSTMGAISLVEAQDGQQGFFKLSVTAGFNYGTGLIQIYVYDSNDIDRGDTVSFLLNYTNSLGISAHEEKATFSLYPNPATETIKLLNNTTEECRIVIINIAGEIVSKKILDPKATTTLDIRPLDAGIYFVNYYTSNGNKKTERLVVQ